MRAIPLHLLALMAAATASSPAPAQAPPAASASAAAPGEAVPLDVDPPGNEKTKSPTFDEWAKATKVRLTRTGPAAAPCTAYRVREWLKVRCLGTKPHAMVVLGGDAAEVSFWIDRDERQGGEVQFPMRRGDRRVVQIWTGGVDAAGVFKARPSLVIQEHWLDDRAAPTVTAM
ncbi:hypothetical protein [Polyangium sp. 15x6]|uniref:hypothetical protein n=1 Tax=Polyangium sp. 15x6 TaxID=3042687 RepID=UPI00249C0D2E|nr:hypothetical protein [Polyangium sp. 15x6]MDI3284044.1 hypothetical protein [Polyangium sp. 15x6]